MGRYCCFLHPAKDYTEKNLTDKCDKCGKEYQFPLKDYPKEIVNPKTEVKYSVQKAVSRGFYGATYLCTKSDEFIDGQETLLKISPVSVYEVFGKDFLADCKHHAQIARQTEHLVPLRAAFQAKVSFGEIVLDCYITELEYIEGVTLEEFLKDSNNISPQKFAQIAIDLLVIWEELKRQNKFHNDLHEGNLMVETLSPELRRVDAICPSIRVKAIDLDSAADESLSTGTRTGDQRYISIHIRSLARLLQTNYKDIANIEDSDFRLIETLNKISNILLPSSQNIDTPDIRELIRMIRCDLSSDVSYSPWMHRFTLAQINEGLNAQTIHTCNIPKLLVDPNEEWLSDVSCAGPQLITGMRGCGKTMLLGALDIHARLEGAKKDESSDEKINRVCTDKYIAISASCKSLIASGQQKLPVFEILFWQYAIEIIRAANHLRFVQKDFVNEDYYKNLACVIESSFGIKLKPTDYLSDRILEKYLYFESSTLFDKNNGYTLKVPPIKAFEMLAGAFSCVSKTFVGKKIFFLLDDASTRYLNEDEIKLILRSLIFQSPICAFKITTERQTLDLGITSPGNEEIADEFRDYTLFDLGARVYERTGNATTGKAFIAEILRKRKTYYLQHPSYDPTELLGDCPLIDIAKTIHNTQGTSKERKAVYHGLSAITALCVGDIGDIITLYDLILQKFNNNSKKTVPVSAQVQSSCFQDLCTKRMYNLENRNTTLQKYALSFAEANHALLIKSSDKRLRQYTQLYVRITSAEREIQARKLRELIDAGIFVFADRGGTPRTKTRDTNPVLQFKLVFRKLFGLSNYIGLSNRDRFELSGEDLESWLNNPSKEILCKNLGVREVVDEKEDEIEITSAPTNEGVDSGMQLSMFSDSTSQNSHRNQNSFVVQNDYLYKRISIPEYTELGAKKCDDYSVLIAGLGFEECGSQSIKQALATFKNIQEAILIEYPLPGYSAEIKALLQEANPSVSVSSVDHMQIREMAELVRSKKNKRFILDITSLNKPMIFTAVRELLVNSAQFIGIQTKATQYYPLDSDIEKILSSEKESSYNDTMSKLYFGEKGPYDVIPLLDSKHILSGRPASLIGILSPKNQRIFSLLDRREYAQAVLLCQKGNPETDKLVTMVGQYAQINYENTVFSIIDNNNLNTTIRALSDVYNILYNTEKMDVDLALTGTKLQAVLCAAFCVRYRINQCWYVAPNSYDPSRYSSGAEETRYFEVLLAE